MFDLTASALAAQWTMISTASSASFVKPSTRSQATYSNARNALGRRGHAAG